MRCLDVVMKDIDFWLGNIIILHNDSDTGIRRSALFELFVVLF